MGSACHCPVIIFKWQFESWGGGDACEQVRDLCQRIALKNSIIRDQLQGKFYPGIF